MNKELPVICAYLTPDDKITIDGLPVFNHIEGAKSYRVYDEDGELVAEAKVWAAAWVIGNAA